MIDKYIILSDSNFNSNTLDLDFYPSRSSSSLLLAGT